MQNYEYEITTYKGQTIIYDEVNDKFKCDIEFNGDVRSKKRSSLAQIKKEIDLFEKKNIAFKPFKLIIKNYSEISEINVEAIRTDGKYIISSGDSKYKGYVSLDGADRYGKDYFVFDQHIISEYENLNKELEDFRRQIQNQQKELFKNLVPYKPE